MSTRPEGAINAEWSYSVAAPRLDRYDVVYRAGLLSAVDQTLASALRADTSTLVVSTPSVDRLYGPQLRQYLSSRPSRSRVSYMVLSCAESDKSIEMVLAVCERAAEVGLARRSQILSIGGGVVLDIAALAATLFRRGVPHVRVPTTLIGMIDAGLGVKNAVNFLDSKSLLGTFTPPVACFIDPSFLTTLPRRHLQCGLAELVKIAVMCSSSLFDRFEERADQLLLGPVGMDPAQSGDLIQDAAYWTMKELELNLFEKGELFERESYARRLDFGHTFSPFIETTSSHRVLHGEAVAIDIAISVELAHRMGVLDEGSRTRVLDGLRRVGLPTHPHGLDPVEAHAALGSVVKHRDGRLNLPLPSKIGEATFVERLSEVGLPLLREVFRSLAEYAGDDGPNPRGLGLAARARRDQEEHFTQEA